MKLWMMIVIGMTVFYGGVCFGQMQEAEGEVKAAVAEQPTVIPGDWEMREMPWPDAAKVVAAAEANPYVAGLYTWAGEYKRNRENIKKVGWKAFRIAGPYDDEIVRMVVEDDVSVMWTLGVHVTGERKQRPDYESDEAFIEGYLGGVSRFLNRYGPGGSFFKENPDLPKRPIEYVEIWNEPNFQYMIPNDASRDRIELETEREKLYAKLLPAAYEHIKKNWPEVKVVGFGAGGASKGDIRFIQHVHEDNPKVVKSYDILSTHPYVRPVPPEVHKNATWGGYSIAGCYEDIVKLLAKQGLENPRIWYTEIGWPISKADGGFFDDKPRETYTTVMLQAAYVCRLYALAHRLGVERVNIMFVTDSDGFNGGFFLRDGSWRPSAHAVQTMIKLLPSPKLTEVIYDGEKGVYGYGFDPDGEDKWEVVMVWKVDGPDTIDIKMKNKRARIIDMLGNVKVAGSENGVIKVDVGPLPVYVIIE